MPINSYFITFIAIVTLIRLGTVMAGPMDIREKATKISFWLIGLVCVVLSWLALGKMFGVDTNGFGSGSGGFKESTTTNMDDEKKKNGTYYGSGYNEQTKDTEITVNPNP